jgi:hypothetical protein
VLFRSAAHQPDPLGCTPQLALGLIEGCFQGHGLPQRFFENRNLRLRLLERKIAGHR